MDMNLSTAVFLVDEDVDCVTIKINRTNATYGAIELSYKSNIKDLKLGDQVVVPVRNIFATGTVVDMDAEVQFNADFEYKWVVQKIDLDGYDALVSSEKDAMKIISKANRIAKRKELAEQLMGSIEGLDKLRISNNTVVVSADIST